MKVEGRSGTSDEFNEGGDVCLFFPGEESNTSLRTEPMIWANGRRWAAGGLGARQNAVLYS